MALHRLTLIAAPAGFGKTTVLSEWISLSANPVAWVSLDDGDNDAYRFWTYVVAALQRLHPGFCEGALSLLQAAQAPPIASILPVLINDIAAFPNRFSLVLDDYHVITAQPIHASVSFLLDHLPPIANLIITSRIDPVDLPLARLRARDHLAELRADDLRFTSDEATTFLNRVMGLQLSAANASALEQRTEGWIAALQLAALSMRGQDDVTGFIAAFSGSNRYLVDYLVEEVLDLQSTEQREFLLQTSIVGRMNSSLCDAIMVGQNMPADQPHAQAVLEQLERGNLFLIPLDSERHWYRYHHLFAEVLRHRLKQAQPHRWLELNRRAAIWFEQNNFVVEAIHHAIEAEDHVRALRLIEPLGMTAFTNNAVRHALGIWLSKLPDAIVRTQPRLCLIHAWILLNLGNLASANLRVDDAERALLQIQTAGTELGNRNTHGEIAATRAILATVPGNFDPEQVIGWTQEALTQLYPDNLTFKSAASGALGLAYLILGDANRAEQSLTEALAAGQAIGNCHMAIAAAANLVHVLRARGAVRQAQHTCQQCLDWLDTHGMADWPNAANLHANQASMFCEKNDLDSALRHIHRALELAGRGDNPQVTLICLVTLARLKQTQHDWEGIPPLLRQIEPLLHHGSLQRLLAHWPALRAHYLLAEGHIAEASLLMQQSDAPQTIGGPLDLLWACEYSWIIPARVLIAQGYLSGDTDLLNQALTKLDALHQKADALGLIGLQIKADVLRALVHAALTHSARLRRRWRVQRF